MLRSWAVHRRAPFLTWGNTWYNAPCLTWQAPAHRKLAVTGSAVTAKILLISETRDAATPYAGALHVRRLFPTASLVAGVGGTTHASSLSGVACVDNAVGRTTCATGVVPTRDCRATGPTGVVPALLPPSAERRVGPIDGSGRSRPRCRRLLEARADARSAAPLTHAAQAGKVRSQIVGVGGAQAGRGPRSGERVATSVTT